MKQTVKELQAKNLEELLGKEASKRIDEAGEKKRLVLLGEHDGLYTTVLLQIARQQPFEAAQIIHELREALIMERAKNQ